MSSKPDPVADYRHDATRKNNPPAALASQGHIREVPKQRYYYDPHLSPVLRFDDTGESDRLPELLEEATRRKLTAEEANTLADALRNHQPWLEWTGKREDLAGKVQMIYIDPPYGINYRSNFQPFVRNRNVRDTDADLTREPEMVKAYRDTWTLGVHTYLAYLRDRLTVARDLLTDSGSIFVQIGDENVHRVRNLMNDLFGEDNHVADIVFVKTSSQTSQYLAGVADYVVLFAKNKSLLK